MTKRKDSTPKEPTPVLVETPSGWELAVLHERRWIHQAAGKWEGRVTVGTGGNAVKQWIPGARIRRVNPTWCGEPLPRETQPQASPG